MLQQYQRIMVAVDGSSESELAFKKAVNVAQRNNSEQATEMAKQTLKDYEDYARKNQVTAVKTVIEYGSPKPIIAKQLPEDNQIDLIMIGATGLNAVERIFIGSVSEYVIRHASCDVLVVRTDLDNHLPTTNEKEEA